MNRKIILYIVASLDGFIARRDGSVDWLPSPAGEEDYGYAEFLAGIETVVMGRKTYDVARQLEGPKPFGGRRCIVFSRRRAGSRDGRTAYVDEEPADVLRRLRTLPARHSGDGPAQKIWLAGGGEIARECFEAGVVNEIVLSIVPVLLGDGLPLFLPRAGTTWLQLRLARNFPNGLVQLTYEVAARRANEPRPKRIAPAERFISSSRAESCRVTAGAVGGEMLRTWMLRRRAA